VKKFSGFAQSLWVGAIHMGAEGLRSVFTNLFILFDMPFPIESMFPEGTQIRISLVIPFAVGAFE